MPKLEYYKLLSEKKELFNQISIKTPQDLDSVLEKRKGPSKLAFRGVREARYKLYSSAQREWITHELNLLGSGFKEFIEIEIKNAKKWQNGLLEKFYRALGQPPFDIYILSFLQHYGAPTPLLDWTYNFEKALFFAFEGLNYSESDNDIENYCSVYQIDTGWEALMNYDRLIRDGISRADDYLMETKIVNTGEIESLVEILSYSKLDGWKIVHIPGVIKKGIRLKSGHSLYLVWNQHNLNIINQEGLFIFNSSPDKPLEHFFVGKQLFDGSSQDYLPKITCYNIHKSLKEYVSHKLTKRKKIPIDRNYIYPQEEDIAKESFKHFLNRDFLK